MPRRTRTGSEAEAARTCHTPCCCYQNGMHARAERIAERDRAFGIATDAVLFGRVEQKAGACPTADGHGQIDVHGVEASWPDCLGTSQNRECHAANAAAAGTINAPPRNLPQYSSRDCRPPPYGYNSPCGTIIQHMSGIAHEQFRLPDFPGAAFPRETGLLLVGHGTREAVGVEEFLTTAAQVAELAGATAVEPCFLEFAEPTIVEGFRRLVERGVRADRRGAGAAVCRRSRAARYPRSRGGGGQRVSARRRDAGGAFGVPRQSLAALGSSVPNGTDRRGRTAQATRRRWCWSAAAAMTPTPRPRCIALQRCAAKCSERKSGRVEVGFVAMATPRFTDVLDAAAQAGARRVVIQPHLLFGGVLLDRIAQTTAEYAARYPRQQWLVAGSPRARPAGGRRDPVASGGDAIRSALAVE